jgi:DNA-binding transcriptional MocR family regulator
MAAPLKRYTKIKIQCTVIAMNLQETVLIQLRDLILRGEFEPGQRLAEQQLAERLGASRTPVRAALAARWRARAWSRPTTPANTWCASTPPRK